MDRDKYLAELKKLYDLAISTEQVPAAIELLDRIRQLETS